MTYPQKGVWTRCKRRDTIKIMSNKKVDPKKVYTATEIQRLGLLAWAKDSRTIAKILNSGVLKAQITKPESGEDTQKRYQVLGKDIINYIKTYGPALMLTVKNQKYGKRKNRSGFKSNTPKHIRSTVGIPSRDEASAKVVKGKL